MSAVSDATYSRNRLSTVSRSCGQHASEILIPADAVTTLRVHRVEELGVVLGVAQLVEQEVHRIHRAHRVEDTAQHVHFLELIGRHQKLFLARAGAGGILRRKGGLVWG